MLLTVTLTLAAFIGAHRDELIGRCRTKVAQRSTPPATETEIARGVPPFLDQLTDELRHGASNTEKISQGAVQHGQDLLRGGSLLGKSYTTTAISVRRSPISPWNWKPRSTRMTFAR